MILLNTYRYYSKNYMSPVCLSFRQTKPMLGDMNFGIKSKGLKSELNLQNLQVWSNFPGVKHEDCMKSIKMFTEKVMPHFKDDIDTKVKKVS